ncbi:MAG: chemotaxis response regulator protein-glutamate methylesterase [Anaerolineae bacterium]|nr:chemotaxis response regulator protein-glutamate methylesterase [Anaerolineae bacterium]
MATHPLPPLPIRVLVVDDSAFVRHILIKNLNATTGITAAGEARDGLDALEKIAALKPDVITLDVEMPRMDGLETLRRIMAECPTPVVMLSALTQHGAQVTIQALMLGAVDFVSKPSATVDIQNVLAELIPKIKAAAGSRTISPALLAAPALPHAHTVQTAPRPFLNGDPLIIIGASTGGPRALQHVLSSLPAGLPAATAVIQHMPARFTTSLAQRLNDHSPLIVREAEQHDQLAQGLVLVAPGDYHLCFSGRSQVVLDQGPRRNYTRPSVDVSFESAVALHHSAVIGVILTGMGSDGTDGAKQIKAAGGTIIAENESTSVVYGMPRSVIEAGVADYIVPIHEVAATLVKLVC